MPRTAGAQQYPLWHPASLLDHELTVDHGNDHAVITRLPGAIDHQQVTVVNAETDHGIALDPNEKGGILLLDQMLIKAQSGLDIVRCRRGKTGRDWLRQEWAARYMDHPDFGKHRATVSCWLATGRKDSASHDQFR